MAVFIYKRVDFPFIKFYLLFKTGDIIECYYVQ